MIWRVKYSISSSRCEKSSIEPLSLIWQWYLKPTLYPMLSSLSADDNAVYSMQELGSPWWLRANGLYNSYKPRFCLTDADVRYNARQFYSLQRRIATAHVSLYCRLQTLADRRGTDCSHTNWRSCEFSASFSPFIGFRRDSIVYVKLEHKATVRCETNSVYVYVRQSRPVLIYPYLCMHWAIGWLFFLHELTQILFRHKVS